jgi:hypothetical protein
MRLTDGGAAECPRLLLRLNHENQESKTQEFQRVVLFAVNTTEIAMPPLNLPTTQKNLVY